jgi:uncharacterized protein YbjT (DUF2867 family)
MVVIWTGHDVSDDDIDRFVASLALRAPDPAVGVDLDIARAFGSNERSPLPSSDGNLLLSILTDVIATVDGHDLIAPSRSPRSARSPASRSPADWMTVPAGLTGSAAGNGSAMQPGRALVSGPSGYVGGRLVPHLLAAGWDVTAMARSPQRLRDVPWAADVRIVEADVCKPETLARAMEGADVAFYLVHSIGEGGSFEDADREAATNFARAAAAAGVRRIVYLGGLIPAEDDMSPHLRSRAEVGDIFLDGPVDAIVLRAGVVLGSGSASFEMLRYLTERLPVMVVPKWVRSKVQPIAIGDVLHYLVGAAAIAEPLNRAFDIGGPDVLTYERMMREYADVAGLNRRLMLSVPVLSTRLSSLWVGLVTPVPSGLARPLVESLRSTVVCTEHDIARYIPDPPEGPTPFRLAVSQALEQIRDADVATHWSNASVRGAPSDPLPSDPDWAGGDLYVDERSTVVDAAPAQLWRVIEGIGGANGWHSWPLGWTVRGALDRLVGGPGLRRGRRSSTELRLGDAVDWWRVEEIVDGELLRLRAEMRLPGRAWLDLGVSSDDSGATVFRQRAVFAPKGLWGRLYWWSVFPFHGIVFGGMQRNIARAAAAEQGQATTRVT